MIMNELLRNAETMTSLQIAEITGKRHCDVLAAVRAMEPAWQTVSGRNFSLVQYRDTKGEMRPMYRLTKAECLYVAAKFKDEARARLVIRWEELERERQVPFPVPQSLAQALRLAAEQAERAEQAECGQRQVEALHSKALFADAVAASESSCLVAELAKILRQNGVEIGQNRLFDWLRANGYLCRKGEYYNLPTDRAQKMGLFEIRKMPVIKPDGTVIVSRTTKVTGKGQVYFVHKFLEASE